MTLYLGIDAGGTGTRARLTDADGRAVRAPAPGPRLPSAAGGAGGPAAAPAGSLRLGATAAGEAALAAARAAFTQAGLDPRDAGAVAAGLGIAGLSDAAGRAALLAWRHPFARLTVATDGEIACLGAHGGAEGGLVVLGTGSIGVARAQGRVREVGGLGFPISDGGSGAMIGLDAVRAVLLAWDGLGAGTALTGPVLARIGPTAQDAVGWSAGAQPKDYAALAPLVFAADATGDPVATGSMRRAGRAADALIGRVIDLGCRSVCLHGGVAGRVRHHLPADGRWQGRLIEPAADALAGAVMLARRPELAGQPWAHRETP